MKIIIRLDGGLVQDVQAPDGVVIEVRDYDVEGKCDDEVERDNTEHEYFYGREFFRGLFLGDVQAKADKCPSCGSVELLDSSHDIEGDRVIIGLSCQRCGYDFRQQYIRFQ